MIKAIASDFQAAATGNNNCYKADYVQWEGKLKSRWVPDALQPYVPKIFSRIIGPEEPIPEHETWCSTLQYAEINYYDANWRSHPEAGPDAGLKVNLNFHASDPGSTLLCDFAEAAVGLLTVIAPELLPEEVAAEEGIQMICDLESGKSKFSVNALAS